MAVPELSLTEKRIVLLVVAGHSLREIAADVGLDEQTVDWHIARARQKLAQISSLQRCVDGEIERTRREGRR